jgi:hypothetical protein
VKRQPIDFAGNVARAKRKRFALESTYSRTANLIDAIKSKKVRAPQSVLAALNKILPLQPEDTDEGEEGVSKRRKRIVPEGAVNADVDLLVHFLLKGDKDERIGAASCIAHIAEIYTAPPFNSNKMKASLRACLSGAISDDLHEVQRDLFKAFPHLHFGDSELLPVFVKLLSAQHDEVQEAAAVAIRSLGVDLAWTAWAELAQMLDRTPRVAVAACETLAWLGMEATRAVPALVDCIHNAKAHQEVRIAATRALTAIDSKGKALSKIKSQAKRGSLIKILSCLGEDGRQLRRLLPRRWAKDDDSDEAKWMSLPEIAKKTETSETTLRRKINESKISTHDKRGTGKSTRYLVTEADLEAWKRM